MHTLEAAIVALMMIGAVTFVSVSSPLVHPEFMVVQLQNYGEDTLELISHYPSIGPDMETLWEDGNATWVNVSSSSNATVSGNVNLSLTSHTNILSINNKDAYINENSENYNYGSDTDLWVGDAHTRHSVMDWTLPSGSGEITSIRLFLWKYDNQGSANRNIQLHELEEDFVESEVTWDDKETGTSWGTAGGTYNPVIIDEIPRTTSEGLWRSWYIVGSGADDPLVLDWGETFRILLRWSYESGFVGNNEKYVSKEATSGDPFGNADQYRPYLEIDYNGYYYSGNITSNPINSSDFDSWVRWGSFYTNATTPAGTSITYSILDEYDNFIMNVVSGQDISTITNSTIKLHAELELVTTDVSITPTLHDWNVSWWKTPPQDPNLLVDYIENEEWTTLDGMVRQILPEEVNYNMYLIDSSTGYIFVDTGGYEAKVEHGLPGPESVTVSKMIYANDPRGIGFNLYEVRFVLWYK